jgi:hypothetical protein
MRQREVVAGSEAHVVWHLCNGYAGAAGDSLHLFTGRRIFAVNILCEIGCGQVTTIKFGECRRMIT